MIIQIYEIQTPQEAQLMIDLGVDHVGSVLISAERWRDPVLCSVVELVRASGRKSSMIPLFGQLDTISRAIEYYQPNILHLCETLPPTLKDNNRLASIVALQRDIKAGFPELELMRSIPIGRNEERGAVPSMAYADIFEPWSDWFLTDTLLSKDGSLSDHDQPVTGYVGITGKTCDWDVAQRLVEQSRIPVILAGGIGPENVARGISCVSPAGVDSCTLTNAVDSDGNAKRFEKDPEKIRVMVQRAREAVANNSKETTP